jgi:hypothetical protein
VGTPHRDCKPSYFIRKRETDDTFSIAELLVKDKEDLLQKAVGGLIREARKSNLKVDRISGPPRGYHATYDTPLKN